MARPSSGYGSYGGNVATHAPRYTLDGPTGPDASALQEENAQLRQLCGDLEAALQEATQAAGDLQAYEERFKEYDALLDSKDETIRTIHAELQDARAASEHASASPAKRAGPLPREDELLSLSEELERERRQLQDDEASLMEQMRQMEVGMARERAEMARQRNDLQRLNGEIRHELERLERNGAIQSKMEELKAKLQDATSRRGAAPAQASAAAALPAPAREAAPQPQAKPAGSFMSRLFGGK